MSRLGMLLAGSALIAVSAVSLWATGAQARDDEQIEPYVPTGSRIPNRPEKIDPDLVRVMQKKFAHCVYDLHADRSIEFLQSSDPGGEIAFEKLGMTADQFEKRFSLSQCVGNAMTFDQHQALMVFRGPQLRGLLAEEAYLAEHSTPLTIPEGAEEFLSARFIVPSPEEQRSRELGAFADCVVFHATADADKVLRTAPASDDEMAAVRALVPAISNCIVEGQEIQLTASSIRLLAAEGLWSRSEYGGISASAPGAVSTSATNDQSEES